LQAGLFSYVRKASFLAILLLYSCSHNYTLKFYMERGSLNLKNGKYESAVADFREALILGENSHLAHQGLADAYAKMGQTEKAIESLLDAGEVVKKQGEEISRQARLARSIEERENYRFLLEERVGPFHSTIYMQLGKLYGDSDNHAKAVIAYELALHYQEGNLRARLELAKLLERKRDVEAAIKEYRLFVKNAQKATTEDKAIFEITNADIEIARRHIEKLVLGHVDGIKEEGSGNGGGE